MDDLFWLAAAAFVLYMMSKNKQDPDEVCKSMRVGNIPATKKYIMGWSPDGKKMHYDPDGTGKWKNGKEKTLTKKEQAQLKAWVQCVEGAGGYANNRWKSHHAA